MRRPTTSQDDRRTAPGTATYPALDFQGASSRRQVQEAADDVALRERLSVRLPQAAVHLAALEVPVGEAVFIVSDLSTCCESDHSTAARITWQTVACSLDTGYQIAPCPCSAADCRVTMQINQHKQDHMLQAMLLELGADCARFAC